MAVATIVLSIAARLIVSIRAIRIQSRRIFFTGISGILSLPNFCAKVGFCGKSVGYYLHLWINIFSIDYNIMEEELKLDKTQFKTLNNFLVYDAAEQRSISFLLPSIILPYPHSLKNPTFSC